MLTTFLALWIAVRLGLELDAVSRRWALAALALVLLPITDLQAAANLHISSTHAATVLLDEEAVGHAPLALRDVAPGYHTVRVVSRQTGETLRYEVYSPRYASVDKAIDAVFPPPVPYVVRPVIVERPVVYFAPPFRYHPTYTRHSRGGWF